MSCESVYESFANAFQGLDNGFKASYEQLYQNMSCVAGQVHLRISPKIVTISTKCASQRHTCVQIDRTPEAMRRAIFLQRMFSARSRERRLPRRR